MAKIHYFYDPLCGWCYGATALIEALEEAEQFDLEYHPGGMISRGPIENGFKQHILLADQRISQLTGAHFGDAYKERIKSRQPLVLDSYLLIRAIMVAEDMGLNPFIMLKAVQKAYYQEGKHVEELETLSAIAAELGLDENEWRTKMLSGEERANQWVEESRRLMSQYGAGGFPTLFIEAKNQWIPLPHSQYYGKLDEWKLFLKDL